MTQNLSAYNRRKYGAAKPGYLSHLPTKAELDAKRTSSHKKIMKTKRELMMDKLWDWYDRVGYKSMTEEDFTQWAVKKIIEEFGGAKNEAYNSKD